MADGTEIALFYIEDKQIGQAIDIKAASSDTELIIAEVTAESEEEAKDKLVKALATRLRGTRNQPEGKTKNRARVIGLRIVPKDPDAE